MVEYIYEMGKMAPVGMIRDDGSFVVYTASKPIITIVRIPSDDDLCTCGHPFCIHDDDVDECGECYDDVYHSFQFPPLTWEFGWT